MMQILLLLKAIDAVNTYRRDREIAHDAAVAKARQAGTVDPRPDLPRAGSPRHVRAAAKILREHEVEPWYAHRDVEGDWDPIGVTLAQLRGEPEFETIKLHNIDVRWSISAMVESDVTGDRVVLGKVAVVAAEERGTWPVLTTDEGDTIEPPSFRFRLSLPAVLLATTDEIERGLHELLCQCGLRNERAVKRKPDIVGHSATFARYGATGIRESQAVAAAMRHPETTRAFAAYGFDPTTGQGVMWAPKLPRQPSLTGWDA